MITPLLLGSFNLHGCRIDKDLLYVRFDSPDGETCVCRQEVRGFVGVFTLETVDMARNEERRYHPLTCGIARHLFESYMLSELA